MLLNVDAKMVTKILANWLNLVILSLIHGDQTGLMPGKGTDINLRRLYTNISQVTSAESQGVVSSLYAEKAFDLEWEFFGECLRDSTFGPSLFPGYNYYIKKPSARVRTNGILSPNISLCRGTRQGCPLSPGLFALAMEPLAILIRSSAIIKGITVEPLTEKLSLYADDALLYLLDASTSLEATLGL